MRKLYITTVIFIILTILNFGLTSVCYALETIQFEPVRSFSAGGAYRALALGNDAIFVNAAAMEQQKSYTVEGGLGWFKKRDDYYINVSIVDTKTSTLGAGISYTYLEDQKELTGGRKGHRIDLALSYPLSTTMFIGGSIKYFDVKLTNAGTVDAASADLSLFYLIAPQVTGSIIGYNLINSGSKSMPLSMATAIAYRWPQICNFTFDWLIDYATYKHTSFEYMTGVEYYQNNFVIRGGYNFGQQRDTQNRNLHSISLGIGWNGPKIGIDFGYRQMVNDEPRRHRFMTQLSFTLDS